MIMQVTEIPYKVIKNKFNIIQICKFLSNLFPNKFKQKLKKKKSIILESSAGSEQIQLIILPKPISIMKQCKNKLPNIVAN